MRRKQHYVVPSPIWGFGVALAYGMMGQAFPLAAGEVDRACLERTLREAPAVWKQIASLADDVDVKGTTRTTITYRDKDGKRVNKETESSWTISWDVAKSRRMISINKPAPKAVRTWQVVNSTYRFKVLQHADGDPFKLMTCRVSSGDDFAALDPDEGIFDYLITAACRANGIPLTEMTASDQFKLVEARYVVDPGKGGQRVRLEYQYTGGDGSWRRAGAAYWAELDPGNHWVVLRSGARTPLRGMVEQHQLAYQTTASGLPFPASISYVTTIKKSDYHDESVYSFAAPTPCQRASEEFYLPNYGIPETVVGLPGPWGWVRRLLFFGGIVGAVATFIVTRRLKKRALAAQRSQ